jgi:DivIVA domain-containing protein
VSIPGQARPTLTGSEIRTVEFREKLRGYHPDDVDKFLEDVANRLDAGLAVAAMARDVKFREKLRGYHPDDVDKLLARLAFE